jgi:uncharacterized protein YbbK (DUF523 family)
MKLISACLLGIKCSHRGDDGYRNERAVKLSGTETLIPVCPEQLGGLPTPRPPQEIQGGDGDGVLNGTCRILNQNGEDVTGEFIIGAEETLKVAKLLKVKAFIGKSGSPSCGCGQIYDGSFLGRLTSGDGVTAALLRKNGIKITGEEAL